jgi:uncharacterized membrane protein
MANMRYIELDLLRTLAIIMMLIYHLLYDLMAFYGWDIPLFSGGWFVWARFVEFLFLGLVGISFAISYDRTKNWKKYVRRGLIIFSWGMLLTVITYLTISDMYIRFGILHLIGISILLLPFFYRFKEFNIVVGAIIMIVGWMILEPLRSSSPLLLPLGIQPHNFQSMDYFPLFPWFGLILMGLGIGHFLYVRHLSWRSHFPNLQSPITNLLAWPGRHSLMIYLVHQPLFLAVLWILLGKSTM